MKIKVFGKQHLSGVSKKTGKKYDFIQLHCLVPQRGVEGEAAKVISVSPSVVDYASIALGKTCAIELDFDGRVVSFSSEKF